jgi:small subunit ribosomal protein S6
MRKYETVAIFNPTLNDEQVQEDIKRIEGILNSNGASSVAADRWGKKEIAYTVAKQKYGNFVCFKYESDNHDIVDVVTAQLRIIEGVMKWQTHRQADKVRKFKGNPRRRTASESEEFSDAAESF